MSEVIEILKRIEAYGYEAYLIGGAPRNAYLNLPYEDFDICTNALPKELKKIFSKCDTKSEKYGNIVVEENGIFYEITTFRKESKYIGHRRPSKITFVNTLEEDLERRDFRMNTLCINSKGEWVDLYDARKDLDQRIIRSVGDANKKLEEDALRILRAIRFACTLNMELDEPLKDAIQKNKNYLKEISYERKKEELDFIFSSKKGVEMLLEYGLEIPLELDGLKEVSGNTKEAIWKQLNVFERYPFSKKEKKHILEELDF